MPFSRKSERRIRRHVITLPQLTEANWSVTTAMDQLSLWTPRLDDVDVYLVPMSFQCYGWFQPDGHIYIPAVTGAQLSDFISGYHTRITDVLRHEWAHALADRHPKWVSGRRFRSAFGGSYESTDPVWEYHQDIHLTHYASTSPCEDFAETFHYYLRHKGRLPQRLQAKPEIARKWAFIDWLAERVSGRS
ncbi:MAG: putative zinc-binding metallo-peptidase [Verrucomicrobiota bacterium]|jgi:hypothetical protein